MITNHPAIGQTTRLVMTTRLRATTWLRQRDPLMIVAVALLLGAALAGLWLERPAPATPAVVPETRTILVFSTAAPAAPTAPLATVPMPTAAPAAPAAPVEQAAPIVVQNAPAEATPAGYTANTTAGDVFVPNDATPVPADAPYTGPFLAPDPAAVAPPANAVRLCLNFGDWRDYDPMYAASPECTK